MAISLTNAFKVGFSNKYNKVNLLIISLLYAIPSSLMQGLNNENYKFLAIIGTIIGLILMPICFFLFVGTFLKTLNNVLWGKDTEKIPNLLKNFVEILKVGAINTLGGCGLSLLLTIPYIILFSIGTFSIFANPIIGIISIVIALIYIVFLCITFPCIYILIGSSLNVSDWFNFKKIMYIEKKSGGKLAIYILKQFLLGIIAGIVSFTPSFIISFIGILIFSGTAIEYFSMVFAVLIGTTLGIMLLPVNIELLNSLAKESVPELFQPSQPEEQT